VNIATGIVILSVFRHPPSMKNQNEFVIFSAVLSVCPDVCTARHTFFSVLSTEAKMLSAWLCPSIVRFSNVFSMLGLVIENTAAAFGLAPRLTRIRVCGARLNCAPPIALLVPFPPWKCNPLHGSGNTAAVDGSCGCVTR
jgi:hypothetical protein